MKNQVIGSRKDPKTVNPKRVSRFALARAKTLCLAALLGCGLLSFGPAHMSVGEALAQSGNQTARVGKSGLPLPRFVSLKAAKVNMRVGPGRDYKVDWRYLKPGLPVEIIQEFDNWRKVRDPEGAEGWIYHSLLSGKRTAIVAPWDRGDISKTTSMYRDQGGNGGTIAAIEPGAVVDVEYCEEGWCELKAGNVTGYVEQRKLWGVYPDENVKG